MQRVKHETEEFMPVVLGVSLELLFMPAEHFFERAWPHVEVRVGLPQTRHRVSEGLCEFSVQTERVIRVDGFYIEGGELPLLFYEEVPDEG